MMTDAELKRCLNDYECESLSQMLREVAANSKHCTSEAGGRIPTWPLHEAAERLEAIAALPPQGDGWQDIASAPKDGTRVLLLCARSKPPEMIARWAQEWTTEEGDDAFEWVNDEDDAIYGTPTHWATLPAPPAAELERAPKQDGLAELRVGDFVMRTSPNGIWIGRTDGEGGEFATEHVERVIAQFYREQF